MYGTCNDDGGEDTHDAIWNCCIPVAQLAFSTSPAHTLILLDLNRKCLLGQSAFSVQIFNESYLTIEAKQPKQIISKNKLAEQNHSSLLLPCVALCVPPAQSTARCYGRDVFQPVENTPRQLMRSLSEQLCKACIVLLYLCPGSVTLVMRTSGIMQHVLRPLPPELVPAGLLLLTLLLVLLPACDW